MQEFKFQFTFNKSFIIILIAVFISISFGHIEFHHSDSRLLSFYTTMIGAFIGISVLFLGDYISNKKGKYLIDEVGNLKSTKIYAFRGCKFNAKDLLKIEEDNQNHFLKCYCNNDKKKYIYPQNPQALISALKQFNPSIEVTTNIQ